MRSRFLPGVAVLVCAIGASSCATTGSVTETRKYVMRLYEMVRCHDQVVHNIPYLQQWPASDSSRADPAATPGSCPPYGGGGGGYTNPPPPPPSWP
jgi:hypothetical protein